MNKSQEIKHGKEKKTTMFYKVQMAAMFILQQNQYSVALSTMNHHDFRVCWRMTGQEKPGRTFKVQSRAEEDLTGKRY